MSEAKAIVAEGISVCRGARRIVSDLSFQVAYGEVLAVLGPNGAGKSTLLRAVSGLLPYTGTVLVASRALGELSARQRAALLSFVPQSPSLTAPLPVREVVAHGRYVHARGFRVLGPRDRAAIDHAMQQADVVDLQDRPFTKLSRGEQERVMLARALCTGARILCLDEPTAALDVGHALRFYQLLQSLRAQGYALVVVLHQLADALRFADRALLLAPNQPARLGPVAEVVSPEPVRDVYGVRMLPNAGLGFELLDPGASS